MDFDLRPKPTLNRELLERTLRAVEEHPERHDQDEWRYRPDCDREGQRRDCQTVMCFAGWAAELAGGFWADEVMIPGVSEALLLAEPGDENVHVTHGRRVVHVRDRAQRVLGLTSEQAHDLFEHTYDLREVREYVHELLESR